MEAVIQIAQPWIELMVVLILLIPTERWIHQHLFGVGYLLTEDEESATTFYYLVFFPGVFLHEFVQWLLAGALSVPIKKIQPRPERQLNGTLRYNFIVVEKTDKTRTMIISGVPFLVGLFIIWYITTQMLELSAIPHALGTGDLKDLGDAIVKVISIPDFWLWFFLLFSISNGITPTRADREGWGLIVGVFAALSVVLMVIGAGDVVFETLTGPVTSLLVEVSTALICVFLVNIVFILLLGVTEDSLERWRGYKMDYSSNSAQKSASPKERKRQPGSDSPIPAGEPMPSIYNLALPIPEIPTEKPNIKPKPAQTTSTPTSATPTSAATAEARPTFGGRPAPSSSSPTPALSRSDLTTSGDTAETRVGDSASRPAVLTRPPVTPTPSTSPVTGSPFQRPAAVSSERNTATASPPSSTPASPDRSTGFQRPSISPTVGETNTGAPMSPSTPPATPFSRPATSSIVSGQPSTETPPRLNPEDRYKRMEELHRRRDEATPSDTTTAVIEAPTASSLSTQEMERPDRPTTEAFNLGDDPRRRAQLDEFRRRREQQEPPPSNPPSSSEERMSRLEEFRRRRETQGGLSDNEPES